MVIALLTVSYKVIRAASANPVDAIRVFTDLRSRVMVPHRYGAFALSYETLDDPERWLSALVAHRGLERYVQVLDVGATQVFIPPRGRAKTHMGMARRPLGVAGESVELEVDWEPEDVDASDAGDAVDDDDPEAKS